MSGAVPEFARPRVSISKRRCMTPGSRAVMVRLELLLWE